MTNIKRRLGRVQRALALIVAASHERSSIATGELLETIAKTALDAHGEVYWISQLPPIVLDLPAPDDDDIEIAGKDTEAVRSELIHTSEDGDAARRTLIDDALRGTRSANADGSRKRKGGRR